MSIFDGNWGSLEILLAFAAMAFSVNIVLISIDALRIGFRLLRLASEKLRQHTIEKDDTAELCLPLSIVALDGSIRSVEVSHAVPSSTVSVGGENKAEFWCKKDDVEASVKPCLEDFDEVWEHTRNTKLEPIVATIHASEGERVFLGSFFVSLFDPRVMLRKNAFLALGFSVLNVLLAGLILVAVFTVEFDSWQSRVLGVVALVYFLLIQPALRWLKKKTAYPMQRRYFWTRSERET